MEFNWIDQKIFAYILAMLGSDLTVAPVLDLHS